MRYRQLGKTGMNVSEVGLGAWAMGGGMWGAPRDADAREAMARAHHLGLNFIDTALVYGNGHSEKLVGEFVRAHKNVMVATKVPPKNRFWPARPGAVMVEAFPPGWIRTCLEQSLGHLQLPHVDLLQLHVWADAWTDEGAWLDEMRALKQEGKIRAVGVSINSHDPASALRLVASGRVDAIQIFYNLFDQSPDDALLPACAEHHVGVLARVPFDEGALTGKLRADTVFPEGDFRREYFAGDKLAETVRRVEALRPVVEGAAASMARGALRFCLSHPALTTVIPGMRSVRQADENCAASDDGPLPAATLAALRPHRWVRAPY